MIGTLTGRCSSCLGRHAAESACPPHKVHTTGFAWLRVYIDELEAEVKRLKRLDAEAEASKCLRQYEQAIMEAWRSTRADQEATDPMVRIDGLRAAIARLQQERNVATTSTKPLKRREESNAKTNWTNPAGD